MDFMFHRIYRGPLKAAIFDWAGTTVDFGCMAPASVFVELFEKHGVQVTVEQARQPMGMHKKDHLRVMLSMPSIASQWQKEKGHTPGHADVDMLFTEFVPMQVACIGKHTDLVPGVLEVISELRRRGLRIGSTTGYNDVMMSVLTPEAAKAGYEPDSMVCVNEVPEGRPSPWMALECAKRLGVYPMESIVKVGDTPVDIGEGLNAGMWTVGVIEHGNEVGLSEVDLHALPDEVRKSRFEYARQRLAGAGAHFLIQSIRELPVIIDSINTRLARGERP
ncbi:MAG: phosphonoacetaldehyde hydrolase [Candidatus Hydrogenedentota bacterium]